MTSPRWPRRADAWVRRYVSVDYASCKRSGRCAKMRRPRRRCAALLPFGGTRSRNARSIVSFSAHPILKSKENVIMAVKSSPHGRKGQDPRLPAGGYAPGRRHAEPRLPASADDVPRNRPGCHPHQVRYRRDAVHQRPGHHHCPAGLAAPHSALLRLQLQLHRGHHHRHGDLCRRLLQRPARPPTAATASGSRRSASSAPRSSRS